MQILIDVFKIGAVFFIRGRATKAVTSRKVTNELNDRTFNRFAPLLLKGKALPETNNPASRGYSKQLLVFSASLRALDIQEPRKWTSEHQKSRCHRNSN